MEKQQQQQSAGDMAENLQNSKGARFAEEKQKTFRGLLFLQRKLADILNNVQIFAGHRRPRHKVRDSVQFDSFPRDFNPLEATGVLEGVLEEKAQERGRTPKNSQQEDSYMSNPAKDDVINALATIFDASCRLLTSSNADDIDPQIEERFQKIHQATKEIQLLMESIEEKSSFRHPNLNVGDKDSDYCPSPQTTAKAALFSSVDHKLVGPTVDISIVRGLNLVPMSFIGKSDLYCIVKALNHHGEILSNNKTHVLRNQREPAWGEIRGVWRNVLEIDQIQVEVYNWNRWARDSFLGACFIKRREMNGKKMKMKLLTKVFEVPSKNDKITGFVEIQAKIRY